MTKIIVIGTVMIMFALSGCTDNRKIKSLKSADASLSDKIAFLNTRVEAVEEACLQLHGRLNDVESRPGETSQKDEDKTQNRSSIFNPGSAGAKNRPSSGSETPYKLTRASIGYNLVGMTPERITELFGKPDQVTETAGNQSWIYNKIKLTKDDGSEEQSPALIVFDQGRVTRSILTEEIQYSSQLKESESGNAVVQTNP